MSSVDAPPSSISTSARRNRDHEAAAGAGDAGQRRLLKIPVQVSVRLAEKRVEMAQLLTLTPGALLTFNKSCEDLLDLYVNNHRLARGEAVKIGEKFGLKINELPPRP